jgi:hypothetical protein
LDQLKQQIVEIKGYLGSKALGNVSFPEAIDSTNVAALVKELHERVMHELL